MPRRSAPRFALAVALAVPLIVVGATSAPGGPRVNDPVYEQGLQWGLERIGAPAAWSTAQGNGITIAVVDSGVDLSHEDLKGKLAGHISCIGSNGDPAGCAGSGRDDNGHGTHVAGIALAATNNGRGVAGVAPQARLLAVRVLENTCDLTECTATGEGSDVAAGIRWAVDHGADVINLSLGGGAIQTALGCDYCDAIEYAWSRGAIAVVAAGNDTFFSSGFSDEPALVVTATDRDDRLASYSNASSDVLRQARWPLAAPGGEAEEDPDDCATGGEPLGILSTYWQSGLANQYACLAGTSMAAPHVAGALALLRSAGYSPQGAIDRLLETAEDLGTAGRDDLYGYGLLDVARALGVRRAPATTTTAPPPSTTSSTVVALSPKRTAPRSTTTSVPLVITAPPSDEASGTFRPAVPPGGRDTDPQAYPAGVVALALASLLGSGAFVAAVAWRLRPGGPGLSD